MVHFFQRTPLTAITIDNDDGRDRTRYQRSQPTAHLPDDRTRSEGPVATNRRRGRVAGTS